MAYDTSFNDMDHNSIYSRAIDGFMGGAGMLSRKPHLEQGDVIALDGLFRDHSGAADHPLIYPIAKFFYGMPRQAMLQPGNLQHLHQSLRELSGADERGRGSAPTSLVLDDPAPPVTFFRRRFCFTGTFTYGGRWECHEAVELRGGKTSGAMTTQTDYLVIGSSRTMSWKHASFGTKITNAMRWRTDGYPIAIISEDHWLDHLDRNASKPEPEGPAPRPILGGLRPLLLRAGGRN